MKGLNRDGPPAPPAYPAAPTRRDPQELVAALAAGDVVIDLRRAARFAEGFIRGTINLPLSRRFSTYAGSVVPYDRDLYLLHDADSDEAVKRAMFELSIIGLDRVQGWFGGDTFLDWTRSGRSLSTVEQVTPRAVADGLDAGQMTVIDVRSPDEWNAGHAAGARLAPLGRLVEEVNEVARDARMVLVCQTANRSAIAASVLASLGFQSVANMAGGMTEWGRAGLPLERDAAAAPTP
jgi:hydroxyacylglutathione hydrolase